MSSETIKPAQDQQPPVPEHIDKMVIAAAIRLGEITVSDPSEPTEKSSVHQGAHQYFHA